MTFAPRFSPDGNKIVMSYTDPEIGNSEIYILDLNTRISSRTTNNHNWFPQASHLMVKKLFSILIEVEEDICMLRIQMAIK